MILKNSINFRDHSFHFLLRRKIDEFIFHFLRISFFALLPFRMINEQFKCWWTNKREQRENLFMLIVDSRRAKKKEKKLPVNVPNEVKDCL